MSMRMSIPHWKITSVDAICTSMDEAENSRRCKRGASFRHWIARSTTIVLPLSPGQGLDKSHPRCPETRTSASIQNDGLRGTRVGQKPVQ